MNYRSILFTTAIATMGAFSFGHSPVSAHSLPANSPLLT
ncbi:hydrolase, partial [Enterococcus faecalis]